MAGEFLKEYCSTELALGGPLEARAEEFLPALSRLGKACMPVSGCTAPVHRCLPPLPWSRHSLSFLLLLIREKELFGIFWPIGFCVSSCLPPLSPAGRCGRVIPSAGDGGNGPSLTYHQWQINGSLQKAGPQDPRSAQLWSSGRLPWQIKDSLQLWLVALNLTEETFSFSSAVSPSPLDLSWGRWWLVEGGHLWRRGIQEWGSIGVCNGFSVSLSQ